MTQIDDYVLVKDKDGNLKYYKDGKFFEIAEIEKKQGVTTNKPLGKKLMSEAQKNAQSPENNINILNDIDSDKVEKKINDIVVDLKINFTDSQMEKRFRNLVGSRLRQIRSDKELKYMMTVAKDDGGLGLDDKKADLILAIIQKHLSPKTEPEKVAPQKIVVEQVKLTPVPLPEKKETELENSLNKDSSKDILRPDITEPVIPLPEDNFRNNKSPQIKSATTNKITANDVKYTPKLMGPIEELQTLDLQNFRRLAVDPQEIVSEIEEKIALLKNEDFAQGQKGIIAWQQSPVFQLYTQMGVDSLMNGKSIKDIIIDRQIKNQPVLSQSEFEAIIILNQKITD